MHNKYPRKFVGSGDALGAWDQIEPYFKNLTERSIASAAELERWLLDASELSACLDEVRTDRYVRMTCQTDDPLCEAAYLDFVENIDPKCKPCWHQLNVKYAQSPLSAQLPRDRYFVLDRSTKNQVRLFRDKNVPLQTEEAKLEQQYQKVNGAMTVQFDGREQTLQQLAVYGERTDRKVRQEAWVLATERRLKDASVLDDIFDQLFQLRHQMALNADLPDYRAYAFQSKERFDYTPEQCLQFHDAIEKCVVPVMRELRRRRKAALGLDSLRPWDVAVDEKGRDPLRPFDNTETLSQRCSKIFHRIDPELGAQYDEMQTYGYLDLASRKGKAPGGYQATYAEARHPFIFMNAVGLQRDVRTLIHEGGHAFHAYACSHDSLHAYRSAPIEFAEVASMGMEMLAYSEMDVFYSGDELKRARRSDLEGIVNFFPWMATIDAFQHWMYTHPKHTRAERRQCWLQLHERFGGGEDYSGYEDALANFWHRQLHIFEVPFYYVEYGIAQLGALQVWQNTRRDRKQAIRDYRRALTLGGSKPLPELFTAANIRFDFSEATLKPLMEAVSRELDGLNDY